MDAASGVGLVLWWIGIVALFLVVIPLVLFLAQALLAVIREIKQYSDEALTYGLAITENLEPVPALLETRELAGKVSAGLRDYAGEVGEILKGPE